MGGDGGGVKMFVSYFGARVFVCLCLSLSPFSVCVRACVCVCVCVCGVEMFVSLYPVLLSVVETC